MADHRITVQAEDGRLLADCSCGHGLTPARLVSATLDQLTQLAHEHIEDVERATAPVMPAGDRIGQPRT